MLNRLKAGTMALVHHRHAEPALAAVTFAESSFFPVPPDVLLVPMSLTRRSRIWRYAALCTVSSVLGGVLGYAIGALFFDLLGEPILAFYGLADDFEAVAARYNELGWLMVLLGGSITPLPYKVITISSGLTHLDFMTFLLVSIIARASRFYLTCGLLYWFGPRAVEIMKRRLGLCLLIGGVVTIGGLALGRFIF